MKDHIEYYSEKKRLYNIEESRLGIHNDQQKWWLNGHLLCNTLDEWSHRGLDTLQDILKKVVKKNCVFFVNRRDFPIHHKHGSSFVDAFGPMPQVPMFHNRQLSTILSFYGSDDFNDKVWPPFEHWSLIVPYVAKTEKRAVFRGTLTGKSFCDDNPRLYLSRLRDPNINAGLTAWTHRDRIINGKVHYYGPSVFLSQPMTIEDQCRYAIILYVDGHVSSSRLLWNLLSGSLVIYVKSENRAPLQWLHKMPDKLTEGIHYVSCVKEDISKVVSYYLNTETQIGHAGRDWALRAIQNMTAYCSSLL
jgi:prepilin-type processing-associated H-X9-DG protein